MNIEKINAMFKGCSSIKFLPDISKWSTKNIINMEFLFNDCSSLINIPNISEWDLRKVITIKGMFKGCSSLKSIPDISKWNILSLKNKSKLFIGCSSLKLLPQIKIKKNRNIINIVLIGESCVGCQCLNRAAAGLKFNGILLASIGMDLQKIKFIINNSEFIVKIWNGPGESVL